MFDQEWGPFNSCSGYMNFKKENNEQNMLQKDCMWFPCIISMWVKWSKTQVSEETNMADESLTQN